MVNRLRFPDTNPTHRFAPNADGDNTECVWCMCRPYNPEAKADCPHQPAERRFVGGITRYVDEGPVHTMTDRERKVWTEAQEPEDYR